MYGNSSYFGPLYYHVSDKYHSVQLAFVSVMVCGCGNLLANHEYCRALWLPVLGLFSYSLEICRAFKTLHVITLLFSVMINVS